MKNGIYAREITRANGQKEEEWLQVDAASGHCASSHADGIFKIDGVTAALLADTADQADQIRAKGHVPFVLQSQPNDK